MPTFVAELEPRALWSHFDRILATPRPSNQEAAMRAGTSPRSIAA